MKRRKHLPMPLQPLSFPLRKLQVALQGPRGTSNNYIHNITNEPLKTKSHDYRPHHAYSPSEPILLTYPASKKKVSITPNNGIKTTPSQHMTEIQTKTHPRQTSRKVCLNNTPPPHPLANHLLVTPSFTSPRLTAPNTPKVKKRVE